MISFEEELRELREKHDALWTQTERLERELAASMKYVELLTQAAQEACSALGKVCHSTTDMRAAQHAYGLLDAALAKNPNPSDKSTSADLRPPRGTEASEGAGPKTITTPFPAGVQEERILAESKMWRFALDHGIIGADQVQRINFAMGNRPHGAEFEIVKAPRTELGCAGHLVVANSCRWKRHTQVGNYRVSSIGEYHPGREKERDTIGAGEDSFFETMVFKLAEHQEEGNEGCGCRAVESWSEIEGERYATAGEAQAGHERYVSKYQSLGVDNVKDGE